MRCRGNYSMNFASVHEAPKPRCAWYLPNTAADQYYAVLCRCNGAVRAYLTQSLL